MNLMSATITGFPKIPVIPGGTVLVKTGGWRTMRPVIDPEKCNNCLQCWIYCPDGTIEKGAKTVMINYDYCKGCGICSEECSHGAITMLREMGDEK
ncbi:4Fe-4S binding protein [Moorella naiadis]|uniref:4Fe-4S binding protein n=1 Tax=Moorella naiadis (nom. illeg.) TaxID=3093670 RepID=UPI003D9CA14E